MQVPQRGEILRELIAPSRTLTQPMSPQTAKVGLKYLTFGSTPEPAATRSGRSSALGRRRERKAGVGRVGRQQAGSTPARARLWRRQPAELGFAAADAAGPAQKVAAMLPYLSASTLLYCPECTQKKKENEYKKKRKKRG
jgi:hypothetical protein